MHDLAALVAFWQRQLAAQLVWPGIPLPPCSEQGREYLLANNGLFVRAMRREMSAVVPVATCAIAGLGPLSPAMQWHIPPIPVDLINRLMLDAYAARDEEGRLVEMLAYFIWDDGWAYYQPTQDQHQTALRVSFAEASPGIRDLARSAVVEVHTHGEIPPFFSGTDEADERGGFRCYLVIGNLRQTPTCLARVGLFGHFMPVELDRILQRPAGLQAGRWKVGRWA